MILDGFFAEKIDEKMATLIKNVIRCAEANDRNIGFQ
jgi:hypothetical protein